MQSDLDGDGSEATPLLAKDTRIRWANKAQVQEAVDQHKTVTKAKHKLPFKGKSILKKKRVLEHSNLSYQNSSPEEFKAQDASATSTGPVEERTS